MALTMFRKWLIKNPQSSLSNTTYHTANNGSNEKSYRTLFWTETITKVFPLSDLVLGFTIYLKRGTTRLPVKDWDVIHPVLQKHLTLCDKKVTLSRCSQQGLHLVIFTWELFIKRPEVVNKYTKSLLDLSVLANHLPFHHYPSHPFLIPAIHFRNNTICHRSFKLLIHSVQTHKMAFNMWFVFTACFFGIASNISNKPSKCLEDCDIWMRSVV